MAKKSAYGRHEVCKVTIYDHETPNDELISWEREELSLMSDKTLLVKRTVRFRPDSYNPKGQVHSGGWKRFGKTKADIETFIAWHEAKGRKVQRLAAI